jgi:hypothetical protein
MGPRRIFTGAGLALAGLAAAVAIGLLANSISGDSVGLSAEPLSAGDALAPPAAERSEPRPARRRERRRSAPTRSTPATPPPSETAPPATTDDDDGVAVEPGDDNRGRGGPGGDSGSSGSGSSGSGSDDSGSDDSGSGGHGSDD